MWTFEIIAAALQVWSRRIHFDVTHILFWNKISLTHENYLPISIKCKWCKRTNQRGSKKNLRCLTWSTTSSPKFFQTHSESLVIFFWLQCWNLVWIFQVVPFNMLSHIFSIFENIWECPCNTVNTLSAHLGNPTSVLSLFLRLANLTKLHILQSNLDDPPHRMCEMYLSFTPFPLFALLPKSN